MEKSYSAYCDECGPAVLGIDCPVIAGDTYGWGIAPWLHIVAAIVVIAAAVWMLVVRVESKKARQTNTQVGKVQQ